MKKRIVWISKDGYARTICDLDTIHLVNILNCIERGELSKWCGARTATYKDLVKEAKVRGVTTKMAQVWS